jgi:isopenicillin-N epimerase
MTDRLATANQFRPLWCLDATVAYLNHGSYGACPAAILQLQSELRQQLESEPVDFLSATLPERLNAARAQLAQFLGADAADLAFVTNATAGVNAIMRSLNFESGDELLLTSHTYGACRKTMDFVASRSGARVVVADLPFPVQDQSQIIEAILDCVSPRTRIALIDHVTSPTALVLPIARLVSELQGRGVDVLVDGAHAPGMVPVALSALGAAYYTGNAHKWLCSPKGAAFLHVRRDRQSQLHPAVISHGFGAGFQAEFDWTGTCDPTPWLCIPESIRFVGALLPGGWPAVMARNRALALQARTMLLEALGSVGAGPETMIGSMAAVPLPQPPNVAPAARLHGAGLHDWLRERNVECYLHPLPRPLLRISAQLYNSLDEFQRLADLLTEALRGG